MRYFNADNLKPEDREIIYQDVVLTEQEKKRDRQGKILSFAAMVLMLSVFLLVFIGLLSMILEIPMPSNPVLSILVDIGRFILGFAALFVSLIAGCVISSPLSSKAQKKLVVHKRIYFDKALLTLREYYGWAEPCLVTKCYDASDKVFKNRDICLFLVDDELRLAADLKHGFSIREKDLGCYAFRVDEISLAQIQGDQFLITELKAGSMFFHLGRRANAFIEKKFISKENHT